MDDRESRLKRRREIDAMVRAAARAEADGTAPEPVEVDPEPSEGGSGWQRVALVVVGVLVVVAAGAVALRSDRMPLRIQVALGKETAEPSRPTRYPDGHYQFHRVQTGGTQPVGLDPCRPVPVRMNFQDAPENALDMLRTSLRRINRFSGLKLVYAGASNDQVYDDHSGPVLVTWTASSGTRGDGGIGYTSRPAYSHGLMYYVTGGAVFGTGRFTVLSPDKQQAEVDRTMAQVVGLEPVDAVGELMSRDHENRTTFGHGDLTALATLGDLPCA